MTSVSTCQGPVTETVRLYGIHAAATDCVSPVKTLLRVVELGGVARFLQRRADGRRAATAPQRSTHQRSSTCNFWPQSSYEDALRVDLLGARLCVARQLQVVLVEEELRSRWIEPRRWWPSRPGPSRGGDHASATVGEAATASAGEMMRIRGADATGPSGRCDRAVALENRALAPLRGRRLQHHAHRHAALVHEPREDGIKLRAPAWM